MAELYIPSRSPIAKAAKGWPLAPNLKPTAPARGILTPKTLDSDAGDSDVTYPQMLLLKV